MTCVLQMDAVILEHHIFAAVTGEASDISSLDPRLKRPKKEDALALQQLCVYIQAPSDDAPNQMTQLSNLLAAARGLLRGQFCGSPRRVSAPPRPTTHHSIYGRLGNHSDAAFAIRFVRKAADRQGQWINWIWQGTRIISTQQPEKRGGWLLPPLQTAVRLPKNQNNHPSPLLPYANQPLNSPPQIQLKAPLSRSRFTKHAEKISQRNRDSGTCSRNCRSLSQPISSRGDIAHFDEPLTRVPEEAAISHICLDIQEPVPVNLHPSSSASSASSAAAPRLSLLMFANIFRVFLRPTRPQEDDLSSLHVHIDVDRQRDQLLWAREKERERRRQAKSNLTNPLSGATTEIELTAQYPITYGTGSGSSDISPPVTELAAPVLDRRASVFPAHGGSAVHLQPRNSLVQAPIVPQSQPKAGKGMATGISSSMVENKDFLGGTVELNLPSAEECMAVEAAAEAARQKEEEEAFPVAAPPLPSQSPVLSDKDYRTMNLSPGPALSFLEPEYPQEQTSILTEPVVGPSNARPLSQKLPTPVIPQVKIFEPLESKAVGPSTSTAEVTANISESGNAFGTVESETKIKRIKKTKSSRKTAKSESSPSGEEKKEQVKENSEKSKEKKKEKEKDKGKGKEKVKEKSKGKEKEKEKSKEKVKEKEKEKSKEKEKEREKGKGKEKEREKEKHKDKGKDKGKASTEKEDHRHSRHDEPQNGNDKSKSRESHKTRGEKHSAKDEKRDGEKPEKKRKKRHHTNTSKPPAGVVMADGSTRETHKHERPKNGKENIPPQPPVPPMITPAPVVHKGGILKPTEIGKHRKSSHHRNHSPHKRSDGERSEPAKEKRVEVRTPSEEEAHRKRRKEEKARIKQAEQPLPQQDIVAAEEDQKVHNRSGVHKPKKSDRNGEEKGNSSHSRKHKHRSKPRKDETEEERSQRRAARKARKLEKALQQEAAAEASAITAAPPPHPAAGAKRHSFQPEVPFRILSPVIEGSPEPPESVPLPLSPANYPVQSHAPLPDLPELPGDEVPLVPQDSSAHSSQRPVTRILTVPSDDAAVYTEEQLPPRPPTPPPAAYSAQSVSQAQPNPSQAPFHERRHPHEEKIVVPPELSQEHAEYSARRSKKSENPATTETREVRRKRRSEKNPAGEAPVAPPPAAIVQPDDARAARRSKRTPEEAEARKLRREARKIEKLAAVNAALKRDQKHQSGSASLTRHQSKGSHVELSAYQANAMKSSSTVGFHYPDPRTEPGYGHYGYGINTGEGPSIATGITSPPPGKMPKHKKSVTIDEGHRGQGSGYIRDGREKQRERDRERLRKQREKEAKAAAAAAAANANASGSGKRFGMFSLKRSFSKLFRP
ncbi:hypothetical protein BDZ91DRAFT_759810 [Kalaharituber pfeilii]|nr:hypothetical protein BDZ91DRAFT_759810 [Kalaharituber pfeilii]